MRKGALPGSGMLVDAVNQSAVYVENYSFDHRASVGAS
jgi:hypothetical protein